MHSAGECYRSLKGEGAKSEFGKENKEMTVTRLKGREL